VASVRVLESTTRKGVDPAGLSRHSDQAHHETRRPATPKAGGRTYTRHGGNRWRALLASTWGRPTRSSPSSKVASPPSSPTPKARGRLPRSSFGRLRQHVAVERPGRHPATGRRYGLRVRPGHRHEAVGGHPVPGPAGHHRAGDLAGRYGLGPDPRLAVRAGPGDPDGGTSPEPGPGSRSARHCGRRPAAGPHADRTCAGPRAQTSRSRPTKQQLNAAVPVTPGCRCDSARGYLSATSLSLDFHSSAGMPRDRYSSARFAVSAGQPRAGSNRW
jgi:hypothetical protein